MIVEQCPQLADIGYLQPKGFSSTTPPFLPRPASLFAPWIWISKPGLSLPPRSDVLQQ